MAETVVRSPLSSTLPLATIGGFLLATLVTVGAVRWGGFWSEPADEPGVVVAARQLRFEDGADGSIAVIDAAHGRTLDTVAPGSNGFLRSTMRGLVRERKRRGLGDEAPFELAAHAGGRLTLQDPATGRRIDLEAFGATNAGAFARLLPHPSSAPERQP